MFKLLVLLFVIKMYARNDIFKKLIENGKIYNIKCNSEDTISLC